MFELNTNIIINTSEEIFIFQLSTEGEIIYTVYDSSLIALSSNSLHDKKVLKYAALIDENHIIHLVALISTGELNYYKYTDQNWSKVAMAKFDMKSNLYNQIEILMVKNKLHILYNYSNLINSNIWTIQHVVYGSEEKHNAIRYISKKIPDPFIVDVDSQGTIHLLYRNNINNPQVYHIFYSPYTKSWSTLSKQISSDNSSNLLPFLFIDSQDNLHALWLEELDGRYQIKYLRMSSSGKEKYLWKDTKLPYIQLSKYPPIIFEENSKLKLIFLSNDTIGFLYSYDYGNSWLKGTNNESLNQNIILTKANSNINKINYIYCNTFDNPKLFFLDSFSYKEPIKNYQNLSIESEDKEAVLDPIETKLDNISELDDKLNGLEYKLKDILDNFSSMEYILTQILDNQEILNHKIDNMQNSINLKNRSFFYRLFN